MKIIQQGAQLYLGWKILHPHPQGSKSPEATGAFSPGQGTCVPSGSYCGTAAWGELACPLTLGAPQTHSPFMGWGRGGLGEHLRRLRGDLGGHSSAPFCFPARPCRPGSAAAPTAPLFSALAVGRFCSMVKLSSTSLSFLNGTSLFFFYTTALQACQSNGRICL